MKHALISVDMISLVFYIMAATSQWKAIRRHANGYTGMRRAFLLAQMCMIYIISTNLINDTTLIFSDPLVQASVFTYSQLSCRLSLLICAMLSSFTYSGAKFELFTGAYWVEFAREMFE